METTSLIFALLLIAGLLLWPRHGVLAHWRAVRRDRDRVRREDALKHILKCEVNGQPPTITGVTGALRINADAAAELLRDMEQRRLVTHTAGRLALLPAGRELALHVVRAHRLWERYLADETSVDEAQWHKLAEHKEHALTPQEASALEARLGHPLTDPHGDTIPWPDGELEADAGAPLYIAPTNAILVITHIEDEPPAVYRQILALGLRPAQRICVTAKQDDCIRVWADGRELTLAPILANNIAVQPLPGVTPGDLFEEESLADLQVGEEAQMLALGASCRGAERRRLFDLGFVPGTWLEVEMPSPAGDPVAYRVRGTVIALRHEQAKHIRIGRRRPVKSITVS
ncbi:MAG: FeoA domain-containing protein [Opitutaceae bacterium]|nr:FeoA domain-containing protein [Opitutaceae bacterium]